MHLFRLLTFLMLNKLRWDAHFWFPSSQISWSRFLIEIHIFNDKQSSSRWVGFFRTNWSGATLFAKTGHDMFSKRRVNLLTESQQWQYIKENDSDHFVSRLMYNNQYTSIFQCFGCKSFFNEFQFYFTYSLLLYCTYRHTVVMKNVE